MNKETKELERSIEDLKEKLKTKTDKLKAIRNNCKHVWPETWKSRVGKDYRWMSSAVDSTARGSEPEIYEEFYRECTICGKEETKTR